MIMIANTNVAFLEMPDNAFLCRSRLRPDYQELLTVLDKQVDEFVKLAERWVRDDDVVVAVVDVLETYSFVCLWIVAAHADGTDAPLLCLV